MTKTNLNRRGFLKTSALASGLAIGAGLPTSCSENRNTPEMEQFRFPQKSLDNMDPDKELCGLLFSQIGYEPGFPLKIMLRLTNKELVSDKVLCRLNPFGNKPATEVPFAYWGELWGSHWYTAVFESPEEGEYKVEAVDRGKPVLSDHGLQVKNGILWESSIELAAADMLERRLHFTKVGAGWQDAGTLWVESCAQSAMIIGIEELLLKSNDRIDSNLLERIHKQITVGCDYLVMTRKKAEELGYPRGAMSHDLHGHEHDILPNDAMKAVVALARASRLLPSSYSAKKEEYLETAKLTFNWLENKAKPMGDKGLSRFQRGIPENTIIPANEWQTRDLVTLCWAALELYKCNLADMIEIAERYVRSIVSRQIPIEKAENGFHGHFYEYPGLEHSEKSWIHGIVNNQFGADIGGIYPNYLVPIAEMLRLWPEHENANDWKECLRKFTYGYLIPACQKNPFLIVPQGIFGNEGPVWFCGTFHGTNTIYGFTAALAMELYSLFNEPVLREIAYGNLQWLAGLNAGITRETLGACVIYSADLPKGIALPVSMMCGVGNRWAGTWFATRGVICNGFSTGKQFVYDTAPVQSNDGPFSLTDEDWIPHSAAWITGLANLA